MAALFACTKCHSRHPFESLSKSEQLCKKCRNYQPVVKCSLCRAEYTPGEKGATSDKCKHCTHNVKIYGEPSVCQFCNLMAAFVDGKCQRCTAYLKKFGKPVPCEQCKMNCAFDKSDHSKKKVDGKTLCWLCALAYKRILAKAMQRKQEKKQALTSNRSSFDKLEKLDKSSDNKNEKVENMNTDSNSIQSNAGDKISPFDSNSQSSKTSQKDSKGILTLTQTEKATPPSFASSFDFLREHKEEKSNDSADVKVKEEPAREESHHRSHRHHHHHHHKSKHHKRSHSSSHSPSKRSRLTENSDSNGVSGTMTPTKSGSSALATEKSPVDPNSSEHIIAINRLQEQLNNLKKQLSSKDQQLLEKDKKITEVKAEQYEKEKILRNKINEVTKKSTDSIESLQGKNRDLEKKIRDLQKQVTTLSKGKKGSSLLNSANNSQNNSPNISS